MLELPSRRRTIMDALLIHNDLKLLCDETSSNISKLVVQQNNA